MFVINANASGSASATAYATGGGGNTASTSVSGYYDIPMNGSTYNMFNDTQSLTTTGGYHCTASSCLSSPTTYCGRDGNNPNETSVVECAKVKSFDNDISYPNNINCDTSATQFQYAWGFDGGVFHDANEIGVVEDWDIGEFPKNIITVVASRKQFCGGEKIGKTISGHIKYYDGQEICTSQINAVYSFPHHACYSGDPGKFMVRTPTTPLELYVDMGLLSTDGTKRSLYKEEKCVAYGDIDSNHCLNLCYDPNNIFFIKGTVNTEGLTACKGDRIYFEFGHEARCPNIKTYSSHCCFSRTQICGGTGSNPHIMLGIRGYSNSGEVAKACSIDNNTRFNGIQFSIE